MKSKELNKDKIEASEIKKSVSKLVYAIADKADWPHLTIPERQKYYEAWTSAPEIGGALGKVIGPNRVRVYLKDTIMKTYSKSKQPELTALLRSFSYSFEVVNNKYVKPLGMLCNGIDLYTISPAKEWKVAVLSAYERSYTINNIRKNIVFFTNHTQGRFVDLDYRKLIEGSATSLGAKIIWVT